MSESRIQELLEVFSRAWEHDGHLSRVISRQEARVLVSGAMDELCLLIQTEGDWGKAQAEVDRLRKMISDEGNKWAAHHEGRSFTKAQYWRAFADSGKMCSEAKNQSGV